MESNTEFGGISFDLPKNQSNVIKVIGVGGGGSNAINHMFRQGIVGVDFVICNTDAQALQNSPVPNKIQLGVNLTEGLGAGANPDVGYQSAIESVSDIEKMLNTNTKMIFITAGMGGGTGTGAAPVIAQMAKERDILTVGIVTIPFQFEGKNRTEQALIGLERLRKHVDSLIVINNNKLREVYGNLGFKAGFSKADEVLATAAKGIAEVITHHYTQNIDLKDAKTVLSNSGTAIMGSAKASGETRAKDAIVSALDSPLLNDNKISGAKNVLLLIVFGSSEITIDEIGEINDYIQTEAGFSANIIMGVGEDETLEDAIAVTVIATGFNVEQQKEIVNTQPRKIVHPLHDEQINTIDLTPKAPEVISSPEVPLEVVSSNKIVFDLMEDIEVVDAKVITNELVPTTEAIKNMEVSYEIVSPEFKEQLIATTAEIRDIFVHEPEFVIVEAPKAETTFHLFDVTEEVKEIKVKEVVEFVNITEVDNGVIKHSLEEYMEVEKSLLDSKPIVQKVEEPEISFTVKQVAETTAAPVAQEAKKWDLDSINPTEMTIEESMKLRAEERRRKLKDFNYKFQNQQMGRLEDLEKEPAFKRSGVELNEPTKSDSATMSRITQDGNGQNLFLRSNNSFLHDNVD